MIIPSLITSRSMAVASTLASRPGGFKAAADDGFTPFN
jgi:hypothetical protein